MSGTDFDVVQIGYGPVGQTFAALAGKFGCKVGVYERYPSLYGLPRAGHVDHEIMRIFQSIGCAAAVERDALRSHKYEWRNAAGQLLLDFEWNADGISGWASDYLIFQPDLEDALDDIVRSTPTVSVNLGWEAVGIIQFPDHVQLTVRDTADPTRTRKVTARYLIAADGGNSFARKALGIDWADLGFSQPWLVVDFREKRPLSLPFENGQICDPARPMCLFQLGKAHRRFSYMVMPGEEEWAKQPDTAWSLVRRWVGPDDVELVRQATYVFESKLLDNWKVGRILFMGDSAHVMPPFMGQGMCSGIRDAANLAWKLALVLAGQSAEDLLDSYCAERKPHVADLTRLSMDVGRISCTTDPEAARKRDEALLAGKRPDTAPFPGLADGIFMAGANPVEAALVGRLGPQGRIELDGKAGRADDLLGSGWQLVSRQDPRHLLSSRACEVLDSIGAKILHFDGSTAAVDADEVYARFFEAHDVSAILVRPDFYIYGAAQTPDRLNAPVEQLERMLSPARYAAEIRAARTTSAA
jgi:2-polyprenyl-6-methoxyphenol hydroxylase-like FAD-dependent oxidoreductase